jgi:uncharacterized membrane protein
LPRRNTILAVFLGLTLFSCLSFAQFIEPDVNDFESLLNFLHGKGGIGFFGAAFVAVQILFLILRGPLGSLIGLHRLLILSVLSVMVTIGEKLMTGTPLIQAVFDAPTLMAFQVMAHQFMKQWGKRHEDSMELDPDTFDSGDGTGSRKVYDSETQD